MTLGRMLVRLVADDKELHRSLDRSATKLENFTDIAGRIGRTLTLGLTLAVGGLGISAVQASAEMDSLERSLIAVNGSAEATTAQLERLEVIARLPGLGFREAVQGAVNLQAVGFSARDAERALGAFGKAIATTGGGKNELDRVIYQLTQMASVGKVLATDLKPIIQTAPAVAGALKELFGTTNAQAIAEMTGDFETFFSIVVPHLERMPDVTGGAANALENWSDAAFRARDALGDALLPAVLPLIEGTANLLESVTELNPEVLRSGIAFATAAGFIGPLTLGITGLVGAVGTLGVAIGTGLLPLFITGGALMGGLFLLIKRFTESKLEALAAAGAVETFASKLALLSREQLFGAMAAIELKIEGLEAMPQTSFIREEIAKLEEQALDVAKAFNKLAPEIDSIFDKSAGGKSASELALEAMQDRARTLASALELLPRIGDTWAQALQESNALMDEARAKAAAMADPLSETAIQFLAVARGLQESLFGTQELEIKPKITAPEELEGLELNLELLNLDDFQRGVAFSANMVQTFGETLQASLRSQGTASLTALGDSAAWLAQQFTPLGLTLYLISTLMDELAPAVEAVLRPIAILARALMPAFMAILEALFPVIKFVAIGATYLGQIIFSVAGAIGSVVGKLVYAVGWVIDKIPGLGDFGLKALGTEIQDVARGYRETARELGKARDEIKDLSFNDAMKETTKNMERLNDAVIGAVQGFKVAGLRYLATSPTVPSMYVPPTPTTPIGGGTSGTGRREPAPVVVQGASFTANLNFPPGEDGRQTYTVFYDELGRQVRGRGAADPARIVWESLPAPN